MTQDGCFLCNQKLKKKNIMKLKIPTLLAYRLKRKPKLYSKKIKICAFCTYMLIKAIDNIKIANQQIEREEDIQ